MGRAGLSVCTVSRPIFLIIIVRWVRSSIFRFIIVFGHDFKTASNKYLDGNLSQKLGNLSLLGSCKGRTPLFLLFHTLTHAHRVFDPDPDSKQRVNKVFECQLA